MRSRQRALGFTYVGLLVMVAVMGLMLTVVSRVWRTTEQREREAQLLWVGHAYRMAISSYFASGHRFPNTLEELLQDERFPIPKHHLRRLYPDPMTGKADWSLVLTPSGQGIMGVVSTSTATPIKRDGFAPIDEAFKEADCYCAWQFVYYANRFMRPTGPTNIGPNQPGSPAPLQPGPGQPGTWPGSPISQPGQPTPLTPGTTNPAPPITQSPWSGTSSVARPSNPN